MTIPPQKPTVLASFMISGNMPHQTDLDKEKIVLPDECGDSLWDEVLAQEERSAVLQETVSKDLNENHSTSLVPDLKKTDYAIRKSRSLR